jgi:hypothetical protein
VIRARATAAGWLAAVSARPERAFVALAITLLFATICARMTQPQPGDAEAFAYVAAGRWLLVDIAGSSAAPLAARLAGAGPEALFAIVMAVVYDAFGWTAMAVLTGLLASLTLGIFARVLLRHVSARLAMVGVTVVFLILLDGASIRPHAFALPLVLILIDRLLSASCEGKLPTWRALIAVTAGMVAMLAVAWPGEQFDCRGRSSVGAQVLLAPAEGCSAPSVFHFGQA